MDGLQVYIFEIAELFHGYSVAVVIASSEEEAAKLLHDSQPKNAYYIWGLKEFKPIDVGLIVKEYE